MLVGFAAETHDVIAHAKDKLERKGVDLIVANDVSRPGVGFDGDTNAVTLVTSDGVEEVPLQSKSGIASRILDRIEAIHRNHREHRKDHRPTANRAKRLKGKG